MTAALTTSIYPLFSKMSWVGPESVTMMSWVVTCLDLCCQDTPSCLSIWHKCALLLTLLRKFSKIFYKQQCGSYRNVAGMFFFCHYKILSSQCTFATFGVNPTFLVVSLTNALPSHWDLVDSLSYVQPLLSLIIIIFFLTMGLMLLYRMFKICHFLIIILSLILFQNFASVVVFMLLFR